MTFNLKKWRRAWRAKNRDRINANNRRGYKKNRHKLLPHQNEQRRAIRRKYRDLAIKKYGGRCVECGDDRPLALCFDHVNNDGNKHRKQSSCGRTHRNLTRFYKRLATSRKFKKYQNFVCQLQLDKGKVTT